MRRKVDDLQDRLSRHRRINLSVVDRKSAKTISNPVWFVAEENTMYLLPVRGSDTQWYQNLLRNPSIRIDVRGATAKLRARSITESSAVKSAIKKFRKKHGANNVKQYYSKFDVAVDITLPSMRSA